MRCIFCKSDASGSLSVEHILPESLGNKSHTLPPGVVCDPCNNYFSHAVEKPFLDAPAIRALRFWQSLENKRGRIPSLEAVILPNIPATTVRDTKSCTMMLDVGERHAHLIRQGQANRLILPTTGLMPVAFVVSRFLAKVGLEAMADRISASPGGVGELVHEGQLDDIRDHARRGKHARWPIHIRKIYDPDASVAEIDGTRGQILHEWDFLQTCANELYFVLALTGVEFTINMGGPDVDGYVTWLQANGNESPLYAGKNKELEKPFVFR